VDAVPAVAEFSVEDLTVEEVLLSARSTVRVARKTTIDVVRKKLRRAKTEKALRGSLSPIDGAFSSFG
jgi:hypothetical protein